MPTLHFLVLETVADDVAVLVDDSAVVERIDDMNVVCRRRFEMNVVLHCLLQHEREVARLGAVTIVVRALVVHLGHRHVEHTLGPVDLLRDLRQVGYLERRAVLFYQLHERNVVEIQLVVFDRELILREVERLFDEVDVLVLHGSFVVVFTIRPVYIRNFRAM